MRRRLLRRPSAALVVALMALFVALGGTSYAAVTLPRNSVGTVQIKNRAVTQTKIAKKTLAALRGRQGATGAEGPAGQTGPAGPAGPINLTYVTVENTALANMSGVARASCPAGMVVTGGGVFPQSTGNQITIGESDWASSSSGGPPDNWKGTVDNLSNTNVNFFVQAICATPGSITFNGPTVNH